MESGRRKPKDVDDYIAGFPPPTRRALERVRSVIRKALPGSEETVSYGIGAFRLRGRIVIYFAGFKEHYSIYPSTKRLEAAFKSELAPYETSGRGTIRFPLSDPVPAKLIANVAKFRARESAELQKSRGPGTGAAKKR
jgi:uncharacterized protein YdhG (YjbR/CyaY superfamily)